MGTDITPTLEGIQALQRACREYPQIPLTTHHYFSEGMYCRELLVPADTILVGKVHKKEHFCLLVKGDMTVLGEGERKTLSAPCIFVSKPGAKRAGYAHNDCVFITIHRTDETDMETIEQELIEDDPDAMYVTGNLLKALP